MVNKHGNFLILGDGPGGNYMSKLKKLYIKPGTIGTANILHDSWCAIYKSEGAPCNCDPDIEITAQKR